MDEVVVKRKTYLSSWNGRWNHAFIRCLVSVLLWAGWTCMASAVQTTDPEEIIVKYKSAQRHADHGEVVRRPGPLLDVVKVPGENTSPADKSRSAKLWTRIRQIRQDTNVLYAEPNYPGRFEETIPAAPNDSLYPNQWWLPAVADRQMWALGRGTGTVVAIIDTGVDLNHPDLAANLLSNGYNFGDGNSTPQDILGHGTKVAGIVAARQNNGISVSGLAPEAKILPIKINVGGQSTFASDQLANAINYATNQGARIINLSLTVDEQTRTVQEAIQSALDRGVIVVAAAGNGGGTVKFPASMPGVIGVASTDRNNQLTNLSNFGPEIAIAAPGVQIFSTSVGGGADATGADGTSFSSPIVAATVADMLSVNPDLPAAVVLEQLRGSANVINGGSYSFGSLNAGAAGNSLVPHLRLNKRFFSRAESVSVDYSLPPTEAEVDLYVAVQTPLGSFFLRPDGSWALSLNNELRPVATAYRSSRTNTGSLFGSTGIFPPIALAALPVGTYVWYVAMLTSSGQRLIGDVIVASMELQ